MDGTRLAKNVGVEGVWQARRAPSECSRHGWLLLLFGRRCRLCREAEIRSERWPHSQLAKQLSRSHL